MRFRWLSPRSITGEGSGMIPTRGTRRIAPAPNLFSGNDQPESMHRMDRNISNGRRCLSGRSQSLEIYEFIDVDMGLSEDGSKGPFRHFTRVVGHSCIMIGLLIIPDLVAAPAACRSKANPKPLSLLTTSR